MILKAQKIKKDFLRETKNSNCFTAVQETDFTLQSQTLTVLTGRSGSGKSTLLNMLAGLMHPDSGKVFLDETDLYALSDKELSKLRNQYIGIIPQGQTALQSFTVMQNICLPYTLYGEKAPKQEAFHLMELLDILNLKNTMPSELSGGELRRMAIARAVIRKPQILLADEPTGDLDDENTRIVFEFLQKQAKNGTAVLVVTHETEARHYADIFCKMQAGILSTEA